MAISLGPHVIGHALPHADPSDQRSTRLGFYVRVARQPPKINSRTMRRFKRFVAKWLLKNMRPLYEEEVDFDDWISSCNYPKWRKDQLKRTHLDMDGGGINERDGKGRYKHYKCKSFMKDEHYVKMKYPRTINSRPDEYKVYVGPMFRAIEKRLFAREEFIKKVPVCERPSRIHEHLWRDGAQYVETDYEAFESSFTKQLMDACEMQLYKHMTKNLNGGPEWYRVVRRSMLGLNTCRFKHFVGSVPATRMSGEMCTSLGNSFTNFMVATFLFGECGTKDLKAYFEGDDGLCRVDGRVPTAEAFAELGLNVKMKIHTSLSEASFCGLVFAPEDEINVVDPRETLTSFGWSTQKYANASQKTLDSLLRAKSLSLVYQYPGCPIVQSLGLYGLRLTSHVADSHSLRVAMKNASQYEIDTLLEMLNRPIAAKEVPQATRELVARRYDISIPEQLNYEKYLASAPMGPLQPLSGMPLEWSEYFDLYNYTSTGNHADWVTVSAPSKGYPMDPLPCVEAA